MTAVKRVKSQEEPTVDRLDWAVGFTPAKSFVTDISVWFAHERGDWLSTAVWVSLLGALNIPAPSARTALHRMTKAGYLHRETRDGRSGYAVSSSLRAWIDNFGQGTDEAYTDTESQPKWLLVTFSIPEIRRADRHTLRTMLTGLGFASLGNGVWIASAHRLAETRQALGTVDFADYVEIFEAKHEGFSKTAELIQRCWDLDSLAARYRAFILESEQRLKRKPAADAQTFADVVLTVNTWRRINVDDPGLPASALPADWPRNRGKDVRDTLVANFLSPARVYVETLQSRASRAAAKTVSV